MRISDWSSDVCSSDLIEARLREDSGAERLTTINRRLVRDMDENRIVGASDSDPFQQSLRAARLQKLGQLGRSGESRVGNECVRTCRSRWSPDPSKQKEIHVKH